MEKLKTFWIGTKLVGAEIWLFTIYIIARTLKTPLFNVTIDPYGSWKAFDSQIDRDTAIVVVTALFTTGVIFLSWWWLLIVTVFAALNMLVFLIWVAMRAKKNGNNMKETVNIMKGKYKK